MSPRDTLRDTAGHAVGHDRVPTCCDRCLEPLDDAPLGTVELITILGVWCRACAERAA